MAPKDPLFIVIAVQLGFVDGGQALDTSAEHVRQSTDSLLDTTPSGAKPWVDGLVPDEAPGRSPRSSRMARPSSSGRAASAGAAGARRVH